LGDIGAVIQKHAEANRFSVVRDYCGHGIGHIFHEEPQIVHYGKAGDRHGIRSRHDFYH
jgi:methionyl aminopeptidase